MTNKIIIFSHGVRSGGAETFIRGILPFLLTNLEKYQFIIYVNARMLPAMKSYNYKNLTIKTVEMDTVNNGLKRIIFDWLTIRKIVYKVKPVLIFNNSEAFSPFVNTKKYPLIIVYHSMIQFYLNSSNVVSYLKNLYTKLVRTITIRRASRIVAVSHYEKAELCGRFPSKRFSGIDVIYHAVNSRITLANKNSENQIKFEYILVVGDLYSHKRVDEIIDIYSILVNKHQIKEKLVIIGGQKSEKTTREIKSKINQHGLNDSVLMFDYVDNDKIGTYYKNAKIFWNNSAFESFGITLLEAMSVGVPVVSSWREAIPEICGENILYYKTYDDHETIANKIYDYLTNEDLRFFYSNKGIKYTSNIEWNWDYAGYMYSKLFEDVIKK